MQTRRTLRVAAPTLPQGQKIMAQTKAGLTDRERLPAPPALRQAVASQEDALGLFQSSPFGMVDVAEIGAYGNAALVEGEPCGNQRFIVAGHACRNKKSQNSSRTMIRERARDALAEIGRAHV